VAYVPLAISNVVWGRQDLDGFLDMAKQVGYDGVELSPGLLWDDAVKASTQERRALAARIEDRGLKVVGLHGLLDHHPELRIFPDGPNDATREYLKRLCSLCSDLGGETLVLGSAQSRRRGRLPVEDAISRASELLAEVAAEAAACDVYILIDPVPSTDSDFVVSVNDALELVRETSHPHCRLHLGVGTLAANREDIEERLAAVRSVLMHVHVNDIGLAPPGSTGLDHGIFGAALRTSGYKRFVSVVMRVEFAQPEDVIAQAYTYARRCYSGPAST
jgi:sugar phosphate isomerase/epimerase